MRDKNTGQLKRCTVIDPNIFPGALYNYENLNLEQDK